MAEQQQTHYAHRVIYLIVFLTGAAVMVVEMLGTRVIAPFYGSSLYVWASIISVTMMALAIGYFSGGRLADRWGGGGLPVIIALAGLATLAIPWLAPGILRASDPLGLRAGAFVSAFALFMPGLTLLGMVGPYAIKLATEQLAGVGTSAGTIYAVSTVGSVLGTLALGFFIFPYAGSRAILLSVGLTLMLLGGVVAVYERRWLGRGHRAAPLVLLALALAALPALRVATSHDPSDPAYRVAFDRESLYGWVRVLDDPRRDMRLLTSDASIIGAARLSDGSSLLNYQQIVGLLPEVRRDIRRVLLIGQGAGHMAMDLAHRHGIVTDTLEIDPSVAEAAVAFFGFAPSGRAVVGDARYEIRRLQGPYDLIIHDCFTGGTEPSHLLTLETFRELRRLLADKGVLALNYVAFLDQGRNRGLASVVRTLEQVLPHAAILRSDPGEDFNDYVVVASASPLDFGPERLGETRARWLDARRVAVDSAVGEVLTDDYNPLEHYQLPKSERYRAMVAEILGPDWMLP